jgi:hypothetical protein
LLLLVVKKKRDENNRLFARASAEDLVDNDAPLMH